MVRSKSHQAFCLVVAAACVVVALAAAAVASSHSNSAPQIVLAIVFVILAAAAAKWSVSSVIFRYEIGTVVVRNPLRTHTVSWSDVHGFATRQSTLPSPQGTRRTLVYLKRKDGSRITCIGACAPGAIAAREMKTNLDAAFVRRLR